MSENEPFIDLSESHIRFALVVSLEAAELVKNPAALGVYVYIRYLARTLNLGGLIHKKVIIGLAQMHFDVSELEMVAMIDYLEDMGVLR